MEKQTSVSRIGLEFADEMKKQSQRERFISLAPFGILFLLIVVFSIIAQGFFTLTNLRNLLNQVAIPLVMAEGLTFIFLMGSTDLSAEGLGGFVGSILSLMVLNSKTSLDMERINYSISYKKDPSDPDGLTISNLGSENWVKTIRRCKSNGDVLFNQNLISEDSITWIDMGVYEYEYDRNGNLIYSESSKDGKIEGKEYVTYSDDNRFLSSYEYSWDKNGTDSVLNYSTVYYYSESGRLDSAVILSESRWVWSLPLNLRDITKGYNYGQGQNGLTGTL